VITNYFTGHGREGNQWFATGAWFEVVSNRGVPFLEAHFTGASTGRGHAVHLPRRDLRGVRPQGRQEAVAALHDWLARLLKG
jgi:phage gpG-like protein